MESLNHKNTHLVELAETGSTNDHAKALARAGAAHGTVVWAHRQTAGRGRQGNAWVSDEGNLFMTIILRPAVLPAAAGQLSFVAAVALAETLQMQAPDADISLKWPNDVLLGSKKIAGILLETETRPGHADFLDWVVVGIGVNIAHAPEGASCLAQSGVIVAVEDVLQNLSGCFLERVQAWQETGFTPVRKTWLELAHKAGTPMTVRLPQESFSGIFSGMDEQGALQIKTEDGTLRQVSSAEVFLS